MIPFGPFEPDKGETVPGICTVAQGVVPMPIGYGPAPQFINLGGDALSDDPRGQCTVRKRDGTKVPYFFTEETVKQLQSDFTLVEIENSLSCTTGHNWDALQFGDILLYTNTTEGLRAYDAESGGSASAIANAGDPRGLFICGNVLFGVDCKDEAGNRDNRLLRNTDYNNYTLWLFGEGVADYQPLEDGGALLCGRPMGENAAMLGQEDAIRFLQMGGDKLYTLQLVANGRGVVGPDAVVSADGAVYGLATIGFFRFSMGNGIEWIGKGRVDDWFLSRVPPDKLKNVQASVNVRRKEIVWRYVMAADVSGNYTSNLIGYNWAYDRWFHWRQDVAWLAQTVTPGFNLTTWEAAYATLEDAPDIPLGDPFWQGGASVFGGLNADYKFAVFSGTSQASQIRTSVANSGTSGLISWATPIDDAANATLSLGVKDALSDVITWKDPASKVSAGRVPLRGRGLNVAFDWANAAGETWSYARGVDHIKASGGGVR